MYKYRLLISYDGTQYVGWQIQPTGISIQGLIEQALQTLTGQPVRIVGAGRTDAGVHALGQVAHFESQEALDPHRLQGSLNGLLPPDIRIHAVSPVPASFHAQYSATRKIYHYHLWLEGAVTPFVRPYRHVPRFPLSLPLLEEGAKHFTGQKDFASFTNKGSSPKTTIRELYRLDVVAQEGGVRLEFEGDGFLYKMVRNIVGTLLEVAAGKRPLEEIPSLFSAKDRKRAAMAAPARGLFLMQIFYENNSIKMLKRNF